MSRHGPGPIFFPASKVEIKSYHLLIALNTLHDLDFCDDLYVLIHVSQPFSLRRVKEVMWKILEYLERAYKPSSDSLVSIGDGKDLDYAFPQARLLKPYLYTLRMCLKPSLIVFIPNDGQALYGS